MMNDETLFENDDVTVISLPEYGKPFVAKFNPCNICLILYIMVLFKDRKRHSIQW